MSTPLHHAFYTNAFGRRGQGFRHLYQAPSWPAADRERISRWLQTLKPMGEASERVALNGFRIAGTIHACLAKVDSDFARDEHGRAGGLLVHALFLPLEEGSPVGHYIGALLMQSRQLVRPAVGDSERFEAYLEACRGAVEITLPTLDPSIFQRLDGGFLNHFYSLSAMPPNSREALFQTANVPLPSALAAASAALPPRLRLACRWAVGLRPTPEMTFVARRVNEGVATGNKTGAMLTHWLRERHDPTVRDNWDIRSWDGLMERIRRSDREA